MKHLCLFFIIVFSATKALSQINAGSVVVFTWTHDKFIIAADSRATWRRSSNEQLDDRCKIIAFKDGIVFSHTNTIAYGFPENKSSANDDPVPPWDSLDEARRAVASYIRGEAGILSEVADTWANNVKAKWNLVYKWHPQIIIERARETKGFLTNGTFAEANNGQITVTTRSVIFDGKEITLSPPFDCKIGVYCFSGSDIAKEFADGLTPRAAAERKSWRVSPSLAARVDLRTLLAIRLVDLTIAYDTTGDVGGPIDALELTADGEIHWIQRKPSCSAAE